MPGNKFANSEKCPKSEAGSKNQTPPHQQQQLPASSAIQIVSPFVSADIKGIISYRKVNSPPSYEFSNVL